MNWKSKTILIGTAVGAATGMIAALIIVQRAEKNETIPRLSAGEGVKVGMGVLGLLKMLTDLISKA